MNIPVYSKQFNNDRVQDQIAALKYIKAENYDFYSGCDHTNNTFNDKGMTATLRELSDIQDTRSKIFDTVSPNSENYEENIKDLEDKIQEILNSFMNPEGSDLNANNFELQAYSNNINNAQTGLYNLSLSLS